MEHPLSEAFVQRVQQAGHLLDKVRAEVGKAIIGQQRLVNSLLIALLTEGHLLLEGVPGIAKTLAVNTLAKSLALDFKRIQFTPDLLPSDLIGTSIYNPKEALFSVQKGPVFTNIVLADEINRAPPKVQSALLEVMQERQVTIGKETFRTGSPFFVLGTQNPIEHEGTYPLPEAQTDRFMMKVLIGYPSFEEEKKIVALASSEKRPEISPQISPQDISFLKNVTSEIYVDEKIVDYIVKIVFETRKPQDLLEYGASPRASIFLTAAAKAHALLCSRGYVTPFDVKEVLHDVLRHRLVLSYEAQAQEMTPDDIIDQLVADVVVP